MSLPVVSRVYYCRPWPGPAWLRSSINAQLADFVYEATRTSTSTSTPARAGACAAHGTATRGATLRTPWPGLVRGQQAPVAIDKGGQGGVDRSVKRTPVP